MATVSLAEAAVLSEDALVAGVALNILTVDPWFAFMPWVLAEQGVYRWAKESTEATVRMTGVGVTVAETQATFTQATVTVRRIAGDAVIDNYLQTSYSNTNDQLGTQVAAHAKALARKYKDQLINGSGSGSDISGLKQQMGSGQTYTATTTSAGATYSLTDLDEILQLVTSSEGQVDFILMAGRSLVRHRAQVRALGGSDMMQVKVPVTVRTSDGGVALTSRPIRMNEWAGVPIFRNDTISVTETFNGGSDAQLTRIYAGTFEDGSLNGVAGVLPSTLTQAFVLYPPFQDTNKPQWRVRAEFYGGLVLHTKKGLAQGVGFKIV